MASQSVEIEPVRQLKLADAVAAQLEDLIRDGHFGESGRLPSERELADKFGVGRGSMREAVRKLEAFGIIVRSQGVGTFAVYPPPAAEQMSMLKAGDVTALELFEVRYALEPDLAAMAAQRRTRLDLKEIRAILKASLKEDLAPEKFVALDFQFHRRVADAAKNRLFFRLYEQIATHHAIYSHKVISIAGRRSTANADHERILEAIDAQDAAAARRQALSHLRAAEKDLALEVSKFS